ncbi:Uncharacterised protein [Bordetella pertussis]|nr:Uncharacterised protein [Bordetella pertussis]
MRLDHFAQWRRACVWPSVITSWNKAAPIWATSAPGISADDKIKPPRPSASKAPNPSPPPEASACRRWRSDSRKDAT